MTLPEWKIDNPAGRLLQRFERFVQVGTTKGAVGLYAVWAETFGCSAEDRAQVQEGLAEIRRLIREAEEAVRAQATLDQALFLQDFPKLLTIVNTWNLETDWRTLHEYCSSAVLRGLAHTAHELSRLAPEVTIKPEDLALAQDELEAAYQAIGTLGLQPDVQAALQRVLDEIRAALLRYRTLGATAFWEAWLKALADMAVVRKVAVESPPEQHGAWHKVGIVWDRFSGFATKAKPIISAVLEGAKVYTAIAGTTNVNSPPTAE